MKHLSKTLVEIVYLTNYINKSIIFLKHIFN